MKFQVSADKRFILMAYNIRPVSTTQFEMSKVGFLYHYTVLQRISAESDQAVRYSYNMPLIC